MRIGAYTPILSLGAVQKKDHPVCNRMVLFYQIRQIRSIIISRDQPTLKIIAPPVSPAAHPVHRK